MSHCFQQGIKIHLAPLWQQAFDWFEVKHELYSYIEVFSVEDAASRIKFDWVTLS